MDDHEVLQHLLDLEGQANALVDNAQEEADRRVSEGEKQNRLQSEDAYAREVEVLEKAYIMNTASVRESYRKQLDEYREKLQAQPANMEEFSVLAGKLLIKNDSLCK